MSKYQLAKSLKILRYCQNISCQNIGGIGIL